MTTQEKVAKYAELQKEIDWRMELMNFLERRNQPSSKKKFRLIRRAWFLGFPDTERIFGRREIELDWQVVLEIENYVQRSIDQLAVKRDELFQEEANQP